MPIIHGLASALNFFQDVGGFRSPYERFAIVVVLIDVSTDCHNQLFDIAKNASS
jgi:hypothetical protein